MLYLRRVKVSAPEFSLFYVWCSFCCSFVFGSFTKFLWWQVRAKRKSRNFLRKRFSYFLPFTDCQEAFSGFLGFENIAKLWCFVWMVLTKSYTSVLRTNFVLSFFVFATVVSAFSKIVSSFFRFATLHSLKDEERGNNSGEASSDDDEHRQGFYVGGGEHRLALLSPLA